GWGRSGRRVEGRGSPAPQCRPRLKGRFDRSLQTDERARPARPEGGTASGASAPPKLKGRFDRSLQTDARARPARPDGGTASGASLPPKLNVESHLLRAAVDLELEGVAGLLRRDHVTQALERPHRLTVGLHDQVAADRPGVACD